VEGGRGRALRMENISTKGRAFTGEDRNVRADEPQGEVRGNGKLISNRVGSCCKVFASWKEAPTRGKKRGAKLGEGGPVFET